MMSLCIAVVESLSLAVLHFYLYIEPSSAMLFVLSIIILGPEPQTLVELSCSISLAVSMRLMFSPKR